MIQAVVFDMGGVLAHEAWGRARLAEFDAMLGVESGTLVRLLFSGDAWEAYSTGCISVDAYWALTGARYETLLPDDFLHFRDNFWGAELDLATVLLARRLRQYYHLVLLSNASPFLAGGLLRDAHLSDLFDYTVISANAGVRKPEPIAFWHVCHLLEVSPQQCVLIDDKQRNTEAAAAMGMNVVVHVNALQTERALRRLGVLVSSP